jgi:FkbM family methyltransferase
MASPLSSLRTAAKRFLPTPLVNLLRYEPLLRKEMRAGEGELRLVPRTFDRRKAAVDVGANVGMVTYLLRRHARVVYAVEPNPALAADLRRAFRGRRVEVLPYALSDESGTAELLIPSADGRELTGRSSLEPDANGDLAVRRVTVAKRTLDDLALSDVGFVKIDVEGHELAVLRGARGLLTGQRPSLMIEAEEKFGEGLTDAIFRFLDAHEYDGLFAWDDRLHDVSTFRPLTHQAPERAKRIGQPADPMYIRNFVFVHRSNRAALMRLGAPVRTSAIPPVRASRPPRGGVPPALGSPEQV